MESNTLERLEDVGLPLVEGESVEIMPELLPLESGDEIWLVVSDVELMLLV